MAHIGILTATFLSDDLGGDLWYGGAERHMVELLRALKDDGHQVTLFQRTHQASDWTEPADWEGIPIHGLSVPAGADDPAAHLSLRFYDLRHEFDMAIYHSIPLAYPAVHPKSIAFSHGVWWADPHQELPTHLLNKMAARHEASLGMLDRVLCCDTDTINTLNNMFYRRYDHKLELVPNFVDTRVFQPNQDHDDSRVVVLFPRRLSVERGLLLAAPLAEYLLATYPQVQFVFCGRGMPETEMDLVRRFADQDRVEIAWVPFDKMPAMYQRADIVIIPSLATEGTSLSCLEAMACGKPVVVSCVGGLTDLVVHRFNGFIVQPATMDGFAQAVSYLIEKPTARRVMGSCAWKMAQGFSLDNWRARVQREVRQVLK